MIESRLQELGEKITRLRIAKNLKQSELAFEAGISERTLQRLEAGEVVKSDGLLKIIAYLGRLDDMLSAIDTPSLSPYELANRPAKHRAGEHSDGVAEIGSGSQNTKRGTKARRTRVRSSKNSKAKQDKAPGAAGTALNTPGDIVWPEDQT